jgi:hypothetical protein
LQSNPDALYINGLLRRLARTETQFMPEFSIHTINDALPPVFMNLQIVDTQQISSVNEKEEFKVSVHVSNILMKRGMMKIFTLNNIGNELELNEMESWTKLIRIMTHEIMNSIAPITSLSETMVTMIIYPAFNPHCNFFFAFSLVLFKNCFHLCIKIILNLIQYN